MPRKKGQTKRGNKSKNNKSHRRYINYFLAALNIHTNSNIVNNKYINSNTLSIIGIFFLFVLSIGTYCKPHGILPSKYLLRINPMTYIFSTSFINMNDNNIIMNMDTPSVNNNNKNNNQNTHNSNTHTSPNQFCRKQSTPSPKFQRQLETENKGYVAFDGCRNKNNNVHNQKVQTMSNEEKDINEIMAQLQSNAPTNSFGDSILFNAKKNKKNFVVKKDKKKTKKKKKQKAKKSVPNVLVSDEDTDKLRAMDENNEFGIN
eukprot:199644_1